MRAQNSPPRRLDGSGAATDVDPRSVRLITALGCLPRKATVSIDDHERANIETQLPGGLY